MAQKKGRAIIPHSEHCSKSTPDSWPAWKCIVNRGRRAIRCLVIASA